jgi:hypothetical protein
VTVSLPGGPSVPGTCERHFREDSQELRTSFNNLVCDSGHVVERSGFISMDPSEFVHVASRFKVRRYPTANKADTTATALTIHDVDCAIFSYVAACFY